MAVTFLLTWKTCGGVSRWDVQADVKDRKHEILQLTTEEVNAALAGALDAGETESSSRVRPC